MKFVEVGGALKSLLGTLCSSVLRAAVRGPLLFHYILASVKDAQMLPCVMRRTCLHNEAVSNKLKCNYSPRIFIKYLISLSTSCNKTSLDILPSGSAYRSKMSSRNTGTYCRTIPRASCLLKATNSEPAMSATIDTAAPMLICGMQSRMILLIRS